MFEHYRLMVFLIDDIIISVVFEELINIKNSNIEKAKNINLQRNLK